MGRIKPGKSVLEQHYSKTTQFGVLCGSLVDISYCSCKLPSTYTASLERRSTMWIDHCGLIFPILHPVCLNACYLDSTRSYAGFLLFLASPFRNATVPVILLELYFFENPFVFQAHTNIQLEQINLYFASLHKM